MSFEEVYEKYYSIVYRYLLGLCHDPNTAEEAAQETFFRALKNIDRYDPSQKMLTWLCAIAKNLVFTQSKRLGRTAEMLSEDIPSEEDIVDRMIDSEESMELLRLLHELEEPYKEVFTLRTFGGLSFRQIGEVFGKTESWARVTCHRAKMRIKEQYENGSK